MFLLYSIQLVDYFADGQHCDETQGTRGSEVHIQCCHGLHVNSPNENIVNTVMPMPDSAGDGPDALEVRELELDLVLATTQHPLVSSCLVNTVE